VSAALAVAALANAASGGTFLTILKIMSMTKIQLGLGTIVVAGLAAAVAIQHQSTGKLSAENETLRQQVTSLTAETESLSNRMQQPAAAPTLDDDQRRELMRLRGEVAMLREQTNLVAALQAQQRELKARLEVEATAVKAPSADDQFKNSRINVVNALKIIGTAFRIYANDHDDRFPTSFNMIQNELGGTTNASGNFPGNIPLTSFEMVNVGTATDRYPLMFAAREKNPCQNPDGSWQRMYLLADGSVQQLGSSDGDFDAVEQKWIQNHPEAVAPSNQ
jgi:hypothetical protein